MSSFLLSPGITPELTDVFVIELPLALAAGYLFGRRGGFEYALAANALVLGLIKVVTDFADPWDDAVSLAALLGGALWILTIGGRRSDRTRLRGSIALAGLAFVALGILKIVTDFYDPFDILLADTAIAAGGALWVYRRGDPGTVDGAAGAASEPRADPVAPAPADPGLRTPEREEGSEHRGP